MDIKGVESMCLSASSPCNGMLFLLSLFVCYFSFCELLAVHVVRVLRRDDIVDMLLGLGTTPAELALCGFVAELCGFIEPSSNPITEGLAD